MINSFILGHSSLSNNSSSSSSGQSKIIVHKHTLQDANPPINVNANGQIVDEATWNSFRNASDSKFAQITIITHITHT